MKFAFGRVCSLLILGLLIAPPSGLADAQPEFSSSLVLESLFQAVLHQLLLPEFLVTGAGLVLLHRFVPSLVAHWRNELLVLMAISGCSFPLIAKFLFHVWHPRTLSDYLGTLLLVSAGISLALVLGRAIYDRALTLFPRRVAWVHPRNQYELNGDRQ